MSEGARVPTADELVTVVGAVIFASDDPVRPKEIAAALGTVDVADVEAAIGKLEASCERSAVGVRLEWIAGGVQMATRTDVAHWVRQFFKQRNKTRLSPPALETLAVIAYRQPVTVPEIQAIRGKDPTAALRGLLDKKLARCLGRKKVVGSPMLYGTSHEFLVHFGLNDLDDLPSIEDFDQFVEVLESRELAAHPAEGESANEELAESDPTQERSGDA